LLAATFIGIYFTLTAHWSLMILILIGGFAIVTYTDLLTHKLLGELFSGLTFGSLVVVGCYIALTASPMDRLSQLVQPAVWLVALPPGLLTSLLLLLNQFSEGKENVSGLSKHKMARFTRKQTIRLYLTGSVLSLLIIAYLSFSGIGSLWMLLALIPLSVTFMSVKTVCLYGGNAENLISVLKRNILSVLLTDAFLAIAIFLSV
jgi:1,4-dihydroxy-2-naphthoate polyprenyltransferase